MINLAILALGRGPYFPAIRFIEDMRVFPSVERGFSGLVAFEAIEVFQKKEPGSLLGVIEFTGAAGVFPKNVVDVFEGLFEHGNL